MSNRNRFEIEEEFRFIGRTFEEYLRMFDLEVGDLIESRVLDCPGGPGSFTAVASSLGADVIAVDPVYGPPPGELEPECEAAVDRNVVQLQEKRDLFVWDYYGDVETRERYLRAAYERFLVDYRANPERYIEAGVPDLPFDDDAFDHTLSAHLLFLYDDRLDYEFHLAAVRELARVTKNEVRIFPLASLDREQSDCVDPLVETLQKDGIGITIRTVPFEFQPDATEMMVLS